MSPFRPPYTSLRTLLAASFGWILVLDPVPALAQLSNPVYVEDSPQAWELFQRAQDLGSDNSAETLRIWQELLDDYPLKLIPVSESASEQFTSVRQRVMDELRTDPALLERYQNIESAEAGRQLQSGQLLELATSRSLTVPGLDALLLLAQQGIEEARFHAALDWLDEASRHPFLTGEHAAHCWYMTGLAAHYAADAERLAMAERRLDELGASAAPMREELRALIRSGGGPVITEGLSALDSSASTDLSDLVAEEIWSVPLEDSLLSRRFSTPTGTSLIDHPGREQHRRAGDLTTGSGTVAGSTLYINEGYTVLGLDRFTGRSRWLHVARHRLTAPDPDSEQTLDMNLISVEGDRLVTLTGHAAASGRTSDSAVLCLNAETGELLWSQNLEGLGGIEDNEGLFPHGEPIIAEGSVFVLARKVTRQLLTSCYVVSLDLQTGELQWARHIASSGGLRRSARNLSTLVYDQGDIYVATPVGAIAARECQFRSDPLASSLPRSDQSAVRRPEPPPVGVAGAGVDEDRSDRVAARPAPGGGARSGDRASARKLRRGDVRRMELARVSAGERASHLRRRPRDPSVPPRRARPARLAVAGAHAIHRGGDLSGDAHARAAGSSAARPGRPHRSHARGRAGGG